MSNVGVLRLSVARSEIDNFVQKDSPRGEGAGELIHFYDGGGHVHIWGLKFRKDEHIWGLKF